MYKLNFEKADGLIPAIVQDHKTGELLMLAYMNQDAWEATLSTGNATYYSRSRQKLWVKGEISGHLQRVKEIRIDSGHLQRVKEIRIDCDDDTVLLKIEQIGGAACHTGHRSCFHKKIENGSITIVGKPVFDPKEVYQT
jgi:phosphoribosyl-AMP cyclohydrolase